MMTENNSDSRLLKIYLPFASMVFILFFFIVPKNGFGGDMWLWSSWCKTIFEKGLGRVYESGTDYLPLYHYILFLFGKLQGSVENIYKYTYYLKLVTLLFHLAAGYYFLRIISAYRKSVESALYYSLFYILNVALLYNSIVWGQVDDIVTCFIFISFFYSFKKKITAALLFFVLAVNMKLQSVVFIPFIGLIILPEIIMQITFRKLMRWLLVTAGMQVLILLPFLIDGTALKILSVISGVVHRFPVVSMNAYNVWVFLTKGPMVGTSDLITFAGISFRTWGLIAFICAGFFTLLPLIRFTLKKIKERNGLSFLLKNY